MAGATLFRRPIVWRVGTVVALRDETPTAKTITLDVPDWQGHLAGQHVDVRLTALVGYSAVRSYSIASAANAEKRIELTVERLPDGEVSPYLTQALQVGDLLDLRGPIGGWFVWRAEQIEPVQLVAGGSGIVPLMSMIRSRGAAHSTVPFRLLYSIRDPVDITAAEGMCSRCGATRPFAQALLYMGGPGLVARCANCEGVLLRLVHAQRRAFLDLRGMVYLRLDVS